MLSRQLKLRVASVALALVAAVGVHLVWFLFVNTATGQAIDRAAFEGALMGQNRWWQVGRPVLEIVSNTLIGVGAVAAVVIALTRRRAWLAVQALLVIVGANVSTQLVKDLYNRPRLLTGWTGHNSLPSGHTTVVAAASLALLLTVPRRWRVPVAVLGAVWTLLTGLSTLVGRWHRPADVVAALLVACFWGALACLIGSEHSLDPPLAIRSRTNAITAWVLAGIAAVSTLVALGALRRLSQLRSTPDDGASLVADILAQGELTAYIGGIAAVFASVFGVFAALLWLRNATLKAVITPQYYDNSAFAGYGANRANVTEPLPTPVTVAGNGVIKGEM